MFYVINKSKIYSYLIALCTVVILFVAAATINDMASPSGNIVETGANIMNNETNHMVENQLSSNIMNNEGKNQTSYHTENNIVGNQTNMIKDNQHI